ncbi:hypothetical protein [Candidatus Venteria ishoeyi]|uniref:Uncharacterized protein n=1 Tax=Candidatus Venteria ishoeyi TaxID=1899563 RepID=A0A1H6FFC9_9GAMM|nr:hypothetical protein [Candidatus Venteria ishoeyi]SEH07876.1 Uncharacterised protein [Candidatus Venteria ishoeyi]
MTQTTSMKFHIKIDSKHYHLDVPTLFLAENEQFFRRMDKDMDQGWQMGKEWVDSPNTEQRCQIAASKLMSALDTDKKPMALLMAAYILSRMPSVNSVDIDTTGEMQETHFMSAEN